MHIFSSKAKIKPVRVMSRAVHFKYAGMAICGVVIGGKLREMTNPAKILPNNKHLMELIRRGLFSLIKIKALNRGCPSKAEYKIYIL